MKSVIERPGTVESHSEQATYASQPMLHARPNLASRYPKHWATLMALLLSGFLVGVEWLMGHPEPLRQLFIMPLWIGIRLGGRGVGWALFAGITGLHLATDFYVVGKTGEALILDTSLRFIGLGAALVLITQVEAALQRSQQLAMYDPLTGLLNRRALMQFAHHGLARASRAEDRLVVMLIDCDNFKGINDKYGHEAGDRILQTLARILERETRYGDIVARLGGDEFVVILQDVTDHAAAAFHLRIAAAFREATSWVGEDLSISAGPAFLGTDGRTVEELIAAADRSMYKYKGLARSRTQAVAMIEQ
jgi:diguanylate cyclase (GGDEF)-like protein